MKIDTELAEELLSKGYESPDLDYKEDFKNDTQAWMEVAKDIFGMANYGGGFIVFGVKDGTFEQVGLDESFHIDTQVWIDKVQRWATGKINLIYYEHIKPINGRNRKFPILYVHGSIGNFVISEIDGRYTLPSSEERHAFRKGIVYTRRVTSTANVSGDEYWELFWSLTRRTAENTGSVGIPLEVVSALMAKAAPDNVEETIWFNLFPVTELPDYIYAVDTLCRYPSEIYNQIKDEMGPREEYDIPAFLLEDKKIYCFSAFDETNPLSKCIDNAPGLFFNTKKSVQEKIPVKAWLEDQTKQKKLVKLLNYILKELCWKKRFNYDVKKDRFYIKYYGGSAPEITWKPYKKTTTRKLVYLRLNKESGQLSYCEHFAGKLRFIILGEGIYLVIEPTRVLTDDGVRPLDQKRNVKISTKRNFYYHNNNYLYDMKLWLHILAGNREEIILGYNKDLIKVSVNPLMSKIDVGIIEDQHTEEDFLDQLKSEPLEYDIITEDEEEYNPLTETSIEE